MQFCPTGGSLICLLFVLCTSGLQCLFLVTLPPCSCNYSSITCNCLFSSAYSYSPRTGSWISSNHQCPLTICLIFLILVTDIQFEYCFVIDNSQNYDSVLLGFPVRFFAAAYMMIITQLSLDSIFKELRFVYLSDHYSFCSQISVVPYFFISLLS